YSPLQENKRELRVAILAPVTYDDGLAILLRVEATSGSPMPEYEALSNVWSQRISSWKAIINGIQMAISANLDCALRHLRYPNKDRVLWVDQMCINQADDQERSSQVQLMGFIYSAAKKVIIWLG
ncbi:HET-domain-containing protein, partial [Bimuria novae-zelandiae CBS 107.79]